MPCAGNSDADHIDTGSRFASRQPFVRGLSAYAKEAAAIRTAKRACDAAARQGDPVRHVPFAINADDGIFFERADPDPPLAIEADSIGLADVGEAAAECERAVRADLELRKAIAVAFSNDQAAVVGRYCDAVGKVESGRADPGDALCCHEDQSAGRSGGGVLPPGGSQIADEGGSLPLDERGVDPSPRAVREGGVRRYAPPGG